MFISPTNSSLEICSLFFSNHWCKVPRDAYLIANTAEPYRASFFTPTCSSQPCSFLAGKPEKAYRVLIYPPVIASLFPGLQARSKKCAAAAPVKSQKQVWRQRLPGCYFVFSLDFLGYPQNGVQSFS